MSHARLTLRIDLPNGSRLGPGKVALLEGVERHRSIAAAARELGMSYRRAWLLIDDMNRAFRKPVVETFPGRSQGAGAALTDFGETLAGQYRKLEARAVRSGGATLEAITSAAAMSYQSDPSTRRSRVRPPAKRQEADV
jgi:molybdate transport system regulatory protein